MTMATIFCVSICRSSTERNLQRLRNRNPDQRRKQSTSRIGLWTEQTAENIGNRCPVIEMEKKADICLIDLPTEAHATIKGVNGTQTTATARQMIVQENILVVRAMISIEINLKEIILTVPRTSVIGLTVNDGSSRQTTTEMIPATNDLLIPSIGLKNRIDSVLQKPRLGIVRDMIVPLSKKLQTALKEKASAMGL